MTDVDVEDVEWDDDVTFVDYRIDEDSLTDEPCERCGATMLSTMAETEVDGLGPAYICVSCGRVSRI